MRILKNSNLNETEGVRKTKEIQIVNIEDDVRNKQSKNGKYLARSI